MIAGIGVDIFSFERLSRMAEREEFYRQILTPEELGVAPKGEGRELFCARLFAAKEAILKALGCGLHHGLSWHDINLHESAEVALTGQIHELAVRQSVRHIHVSFSSSTRQVVAIAVLETHPTKEGWTDGEHGLV